MTEKLTAINSAGYPTLAARTADPVIFSVVDGRLCVLLVTRTEAPFEGQPCLPGGFVDELDERSIDTAARKLTEKTGMPAVYLEQLHAFDALGRDPRGRIESVAYLALVPADLLPDGSDGRWTAVSDIPDLAFDHDEMVRMGHTRLLRKMWESNIAMGLLAQEFTMPEARHVFEAVLDVEYDPANFNRDLLATALVEPTGRVEKLRPSGGRPAKLYRWVSRDPEWRPRAYWHPSGRSTARRGAPALRKRP